MPRLGRSLPARRIITGPLVLAAPGVGNSTVRVVEMGLGDGATPNVTITGPTSLEAGELFTLTAVPSGGAASGFVWEQLTGPTVTTTISASGDTLSGTAPIGMYGTSVSFKATVAPGGDNDTITIPVSGGSRFWSINGEWVPVVRYRLSA